MAAVTTNITQHHFTQRPAVDSTDGSMDSNDISNHYGRESPSIDNNSCCSDDTVLSVGKETPPPTQTLSFKNIESHLNAISQLTNSTLADIKSTYQSSNPNSPLSSNRLSPMSTKSLESPYNYKSDISETKSSPTSPIDSSFISPIFRPSLTSTTTSSPEASPKSIQSPKSNDTIFFRQTKQNDININNEPSNPALKFSIDNILKADFGRRITDPINIKKTKPKKTNFDELNKSTSTGTPTTGPVDLSKTETENPTAAGDSKSSPMLWPAWVYCTRYSDRPSSGKFLYYLHT